MIEQIPYGHDYKKPRLLDLFCKAGGTSVGYARAGFEVEGVDHEPQPNYPFKFHLADAMTFPLEGYDVVHASPPCQAYTSLGKGNHPDLIGPLRRRLRDQQRIYIIENVVGAPLLNPMMLCGSMFDLKVRRHRLFETNFFMLNQPCNHSWTDEIRAYYGKKGWLVWTPAAANVQKNGRKPLLRGSVELAPQDMGIDWMTWDELREAIPPAYTEYIGHQLMRMLRNGRAD